MAARAPIVTELLWAFQILAAAQFFMTGLDKVSDAPVMVQLLPRSARSVVPVRDGNH